LKGIRQRLLEREAKRLRELMSKLGYSRTVIVNVLAFYGVELEDMVDCPLLGKIY